MKIYNSKNRKKEDFIPIDSNNVKIYSCGPTVYNYFHIGNARPFIVFDVLRRYLEYKGYNVIFVQNFTDIDDKMIKRAKEENISVKELGDKFINEYFKDSEYLGIKKASVHPRATEHISDIINLINSLIEKKMAYISGGDVFFKVNSFKRYGCLCGQHLKDLESGARIEIDEKKENPLDFVLWKAAKEGEPYWDSPFGKGRPGWHIECSAMSMKYLGETIDIHCGGKDLLFPHHENEIAQSESFTGKEFVRYWMHNGFININNEKMSKSKGNFFTIRDLSDKYDGQVLRMFMLQVHYRSPINYSDEILAQAENALNRIKNAHHEISFYINKLKNTIQFNESDIAINNSLETLKKNFIISMDDDLNTADAISHIFTFIKDVFLNIEKVSSIKVLEEADKTMLELLNILGLKVDDEEEIPNEIKQLLEERKHARNNKNYNLSDIIRDKIKILGYIVEDTKDGQKIKKI